MHFGESMNLARIKAMSLVICALCKVQRVAEGIIIVVIQKFVSLRPALT